jgi:hypothetical protein
VTAVHEVSTMIWALTAAAAVWSAQPALPPPPYDDTQRGTESEARALIAALRVSDDSLVSIRWTQRNERVAGEGWEPAEESQRWIDGGRWAFDQTVHLRRENDGVPVSPSFSYRFDGQVVRTLNRDTHRGKVCAARPADTAMWATPPKYMGRYLDVNEHRTLPEILMDAQELRVRPGQGGASRIVSGYAEVNNHAWFVEVAIDTARGFSPTCITLYDALLRRPIERLKVETLENREGAWVPVSGTDVLWYLPGEMKDPRWDRLQERVRPLAGEAGLPNPSDPVVRAAYKAAIEEIYGPDGIPVELLGPPHRLLVTEVISVNKPMADREFDLELPKDAVMVDFLRLRSSDGKPVAISP